MIDGILNIYKEQGYTSFDVVARLRGILKQKKIGHTGTLDPMAEGVLVVCLGKATKLVDMLTYGYKEYTTEMLLGKATDTEDISGKIICERDVPSELTCDAVINTVEGFVGTYSQIPPMYSAIKKDGRKLYEYARNGIQVERTPREVTIFSIDNIAVKLPYISFDVRCSKGTYIRSLCRDIGEALGICGTMTALKRDKVMDFTIDNALKLDRVEELNRSGQLLDYVLPVEMLLSDYKACYIKKDYTKFLLNGNKLYPGQLVSDGKIDDREIVRIYIDKEFAALYIYNDNEKILKPYKMFLG